jgi:molybdopterin-binding protein
MATYRIREAAQLVGVSDDTLRRWIDADRISATSDASGRLVVDGADLAKLAEDAAAEQPPVGPVIGASARNRFVGLVTRVVRDTVMAQVDLQAGPHRVVSLMSREAADALGLEPGVLAVATIKSTNVGIEVPQS